MTRDTRETFDTKINELNNSLIELSSIVEQAILGSVKSLVERDLTSAKSIYEGDKLINERRYEIERRALIVVATQQPMATDLRQLSSIIDIAGELERIGDYAKGIARIAMRLGDQPVFRKLVHIPKMADKTVDMLHRAIAAFVNLDEESGLSIPREDDQIDVLYNLIYQELLELMIQTRIILTGPLSTSGSPITWSGPLIGLRISVNAQYLLRLGIWSNLTGQMMKQRLFNPLAPKVYLG